MSKNNKQTTLNRLSPINVGFDNEIPHLHRVNSKIRDHHDEISYLDTGNPEGSDVDNDLSSDQESSGWANGNIFAPKTKLPQCITRQRSIQNLLALINNGMIDICPEYQRSVVWTKDRQSGLIDSLMENYYVPPIIFNKKSSSKQILVCVDGKQRLSSIKAFVEGSIPCRDAENRPWYFCRPKPGQDGKKLSKRNILPQHMKEQFTQKILVCCEIADLSRAQEEDLFSRVQLGLPLSSAEKMRAKSGPWHELAKLFEQDFEEVVRLSATDRARGFQNLLICFAQILEVQNHTNEDSHPTLKSNWRSLEKFAHDPSTLTQSRRSHLAKVFTTFKELVVQDIQTFKNNSYKRAKNFAPIEMVAVAVLISQYGEAMRPEELLKLIRAMRHTARQHALDLFTNKATWEIFWQFIMKVGVERREVLERRRLSDAEAFDHVSLDSSDEESDTRLLQQFKPRKSTRKQTTSSHTATSSLKRKRSSDLAAGPQVKLAQLSAIATPNSVSNSTPNVAPILNRNIPVANNKANQEENADTIDADTHSTSSGYSSHPETRHRLFWNNPSAANAHRFSVEEHDQMLSSSPVPIPQTGDATADIVHRPAHENANILATDQTQDHQVSMSYSNGIQVGTSELPIRIRLMANHFSESRQGGDGS